MQVFLGLSLLTFGITFALYIPFINFLYKARFIRGKETEEVRKDASANFYKMRQLHAKKIGTPTGGGILQAIVLMVMFALTVGWVGTNIRGLLSGYSFWWEVGIIFSCFISFGILGFYDDLIKIFGYEKSGFFGLRMRHKLFIQIALAAVVAGLMHWGLKIDFVYVPFWGIVRLGIGYFFLATFLIVAFANAFDITDGLDGLSNGLLFICLLAFWAIAAVNLDGVLSLFIALWVGVVGAFLYFNIWPARIMLGNTGGLAFGATLAVIGLLSGKILALLIIAGLFVVDGGSSLIQILSKKLRHGKRVFPIAPIHHWLEIIGWEEPKIVARAWLAGIALAIFGLWLAFL